MLFKFSKATCLNCHVDPHDGRYVGADSPDGKYAAADPLDGKRACADCHDVERFRPSLVGIQEHGRFAYPLEGAHRAVACVVCHRDLERPPITSSLIGGAATIAPKTTTPAASAPATTSKTPAATAPITFVRKHDDCVDCHADVHEGQLRGPCSRCHDTSAFGPASRFVHDRDAAFSLAGAHSKAACDRCHPATIDAAGKRRVTFRPIPVACAACHAETPGIVAPTESDSMRPPPNPALPGSGTPR
jgi:hypothetical protein